MKNEIIDSILINGKRKMGSLLIVTLLVFGSSSLSAQCNNTLPFATVTAPSFGVVTIATCTFTGDYATMNAVPAATDYLSESTGGAGNFITIRQASSGGAVIAFGPSPLFWTSTFAGTYFLHINVNAECGIDFDCHTHTIRNMTAVGCTNTNGFGLATAPSAGAGPLTISTCTFAGEYSTVNDVAGATNYQSESTGGAGNFITIRQGTSGGPVIAFGPSPLFWTSTVAGTYFQHINVNAECDNDLSCHTQTIRNMTGVGCINTNGLGTVTAPSTGAGPLVITNCNFAGDYNTINSAASATNYQSVVTGGSGNFITIRQGTPGGTFIASGISPLTWTSTIAGTYFQHINMNAACGTQGSCRASTIQNMTTCINSIAFGIATAPAVGAAPLTISTCNLPGDYNTINSVTAATTYQSVVNGGTGNFITIRQGTPAGTVIASGVSPLTWTSTIAGTYFQHINTNAACGLESGCRVSTIQNMTGGAVGIEEKAEFEFIVYPNPSRGTITVQISESIGDYQLSILDVMGREVYTGLGNGPTSSYTLNGLASGKYMLRISNNSFSKTQSIVISE